MISAEKSKHPRPLGDLNATMRDLDLDSDAVRALVDEGKLVAFDIAAGRAARSELRVLTKSIEHYQTTGGAQPLDLDWPGIVRLVLPTDKLFVRGIEVRRALNCDRGHVENLILAGCLAVVKKPKKGPGGSPIITRESVEAFLKDRMQ